MHFLSHLPELIATLSTAIVILLCTVVVIPFIVACASVFGMAKRLGRSSILWVLLSIFSINPLVCLICLYGLGETDEHRRKRVIEEEEWKNKTNLSRLRRQEEKH